MMGIEMMKDTRQRPRLSLLDHLLLTLLLTVSVNKLHVQASPIIYFTNQSSIDRLEDNVATPVIQVDTKPRSLDCNSCDNRIYWSTDKVIMRSFANTSTVETVLNISLKNPIGVAIDWRSDLIYFTDHRQVDSENQQGYVGVASCDGSYQRIFTNLNINDAGPIVVDPLHGFMFFADIFCCIWRASLDGNKPLKIYTIPIPYSTNEILDLSVDILNSSLYWNVDGTVYRSDLSGGGVEHVVRTLTNPASLSVGNGTLYLSRKNNNGNNGSIFSYSLGSSLLSTVIENNSLDPGDISAFLPKSFVMSVTGGCSNNNGGCSRFCFTLPDSEDPDSISTNHRCSCPTGFRLNSNNRTCNTVPQVFLLIAQASFINILSFDVQGEGLPLPLPFHGNGEKIQFITYDRKHDFLYWSQTYPPAIMRSKIDGSQREVIISESIAIPVGVAINEDGSTLYWADVGLDKIEVVSVDSSGSAHKRRVIVDTGIDHPQGIALNEELGFLYWTDTGHSPSVRRSKLDGSSQQVLVSNSHATIILPGAIAVHPSTGDVYWVETHLHNRKICKINKNGADLICRTNTEDESIAGIFFLGDVLYWTDKHNALLRRVNVNEFRTSSGVVVSRGLGGVSGVTAVNDTQVLSDHGCLTDNGRCDDICVLTGVNGTRQCLCREYYKLKDGSETTCVTNSSSYLLLASEESIFISTDRHIAATIKIDVPVRSLDTDTVENMIYWINSEDGGIYRGFVPASSPNMSTYAVQHLVACCHGNIADIAVDWWGRNLYWTNDVLGTVGVAKLNGNNQQVLVSGLLNPQRIVVNPYRSAIYFSTDVGIQSVPLTGGHVSTIWTKPPQNMSAVPTSVPVLDLTLDVTEQILFWSWNRCIYEYQVLPNHVFEKVWCGFNHDDSPHTSPSPSLLTYYDDQLHFLLPSLDQVYYFMEHSEEDGERIRLEFWTTLFFSVSGRNVTSFKYSHHSVQPDTHWCSRNGECGIDDDTLCLVKDHYYFECRCSPTKFKTFAYDKNRDVCRHTCNTANSFVVLSSPSNVFLLPLLESSSPDPDAPPNCVTPPPQAQPLHIFVNQSDLGTMSYEPFTEQVLWTDANNVVHSSFLNGTGQGILDSRGANGGGKTPGFIPSSFYSMATDWLGGHVFWADPVTNQINFVRTSGRHRGSSGTLLKPTISRTTRPVAVVMDTKGRRLYFSDGYNLNVQYIAMDMGSFDPVPLELSNRKLYVEEMAFDELKNVLYWCDKSREVIEKYDVVSGNVTELINNANNITAMTAIRFHSRLYLYWYNRSDWSIYSYDVAAGAVAVHVELEEGTVINSLDSHDGPSFDDAVPLCAESSCSHICLVASVNSTSVSCGCPGYRTLLSDDQTCSAPSCPTGLQSCADGSDCIFYSQFCDGRGNCLDKSDERDCKCSVDRFNCPNDTNNVCIDRAKVCNGVPDCSDGFDEYNCSVCGSGLTCLLGNNIEQCISADWICDGQIDCVDGEDESNCTRISPTTPLPTSSSASVFSTTPTPSTGVTPTNSPTGIIGIIVATCLIIIVMVLTFAFVLCFLIQCVLSKKRNVTYTSRYDFPNSSIKSGSSPQPHLTSINTSDLSINTMETGSTHVEKGSEDARNIKRLSTISTDPSNPPNSPITTHRSVALMENDETSVLSRPYSEMEHPIPQAPNPSMNFEVMSNISSVSQHRLPYVNHHGNGVLPLAPPPSSTHFLVHHGDHLHHHSPHVPPPPPYHHHQSYYEPHLDLIDEDVLTLDEQDSISQFRPVPHPSPRPSPHRVMPHLSPHLSPSHPFPSHTALQLSRLQPDNVSEHTCTTISMTTFIEPLPSDYIPSSTPPPRSPTGGVEEGGDGEGEEGDDEEGVPNVQSYYDCPPPPSPVTELSINLA